MMEVMPTSPKTKMVEPTDSRSTLVATPSPKFMLFSWLERKMVSAMILLPMTMQTEKIILKRILCLSSERFTSYPKKLLSIFSTIYRKNHHNRFYNQYL